MSFIADKIVMDGLTYDDVLLIPAYSEVLPKTVELTTKFSRNTDSPFTGNGNGHFRFCNRIHSGSHKRDFQLDVA